jgi:hypothetical protein
LLLYLFDSVFKCFEGAKIALLASNLIYTMSGNFTHRGVVYEGNRVFLTLLTLFFDNETAKTMIVDVTIFTQGTGDTHMGVHMESKILNLFDLMLLYDVPFLAYTRDKAKSNASRSTFMAELAQRNVYLFSSQPHELKNLLAAATKRIVRRGNVGFRPPEIYGARTNNLIQEFINLSRICQVPRPNNL